MLKNITTEDDLDALLNSITVYGEDFPEATGGGSESSTSSIISVEVECVPSAFEAHAENQRVTRQRVVKATGEQAERMVNCSANEFSPIHPSSVKIKISTVDRTKTDLPNIIGVVMEIVGDCYRVRTRYGILESLSRWKFTVKSFY